MKLLTVVIIVGLIAIPVIGFGVYSAMSAPLPIGFPPPTEKGKIEIKHYPAYRSGTYTYIGQLSQAANAAFEPLYRHITSNNIPMTAPVETRYPIITLQEGQSGKTLEVGQAEVSFLYRDKDVHPQNIAQGIQVEDHPAMTVVSIGLQGAYTFASYQQNLERLREWLRQHPNYTVSGPPRRFFYDSPFTPDVLKCSEVQIPIK
ncbi:MAG: heme-binding protein [Stigonema ocellatum SAG 48.90 = DSM 106950]|nr:heme-binding protein [Stigonema ocellatum SAG 48.90 = DSM 106950]